MKGRTWQAAENFTLADLSLCVTVSQIEAFGMSLNPYVKIKQWFKICKDHLEPFGYDVSVILFDLLTKIGKIDYFCYRRLINMVQKH